MPTQHKALILDACCVMNLYASGQMEAVLAAVAEMTAVARYVAQVEALTVYKTSKLDSGGEREPINLQPLLNKGILRIVDLETAAEKADLVRFAAARLDDGEATTMAIAVNRSWSVATDDRVAHRLLSESAPTIPILSTPELMKQWQEAAAPPPALLRAALLNIERRANYLVGRRHPLFQWWEFSKKAAP